MLISMTSRSREREEVLGVDALGWTSSLRMRSICAWIVIFAAAGASTGCVPPLPSLPEAAAEDLLVTAAVKTALLNDSELDGVQIDVETAEGIVTLSGVVSTVEAAQRAVALTRAAKGVLDVRSHLRIEREPSANASGGPSNVGQSAEHCGSTQPAPKPRI